MLCAVKPPGLLAPCSPAAHPMSHLLSTTGCCLVLALCIISGKKYRDYRVKKNLPSHLMDIWGDTDSEVRQPNFLPADKKLRHMERHLYIGAEGRNIRADWQDLVESGMMEVGESWEVFTNPMFEQTVNEDAEEDGRRLWAFQETENGEFEFINTAFIEHAEEEPAGGDMETAFVECQSSNEEVDGVSEKGEDEGRESCFEEGESEGEGSSGSEEEGSGSSSEESNEGEGEKSGSGGEEESEQGSVKEVTVSREDTEGDVAGAEDTSPTTALLPEAGCVKEEKCALAPMTQEEMELAMQELQRTEQEIAGDPLVGWDDIENLLFNQWAETQELEDGRCNLRL